MRAFHHILQWGLLTFGAASISCASAPPPKPEPKEELGFAPVRQTAPPKPSTLATPGRDALENLLHGRFRPRSRAEYEQMAARIAGEVTAARGLKLKRGLELELLENANFERTIEASRGGTLSDQQQREFLAQLFAFGFAEIDEPPKKPGEQQEESKYPGVLGVYDPDTQKLFVRMHTLSNSLYQEEQMQATIAHEIQHALQHQHFGLIDLEKIPNWDQLRAVKSLYEGDAELARVLYVSGGRNVEAITNHALGVRLQSRWSDRIRQVGFSSSISEAAPYLRETTMFPYEEGSVFLSTLYLTGGMELVNQVFAHPPVSTEQVLHPQKYIDGDPPIPVPPPRVVPEQESIGIGRLGELGIRVLIEQCSDPAKARTVAEGWGGDAYRISKNASGQLSLSWTTVWDSEEDAKQFASAVPVLKDCWKKASSKDYSWSITGRFNVRRRGNVVTVVRGLPADLESGELGAMASYQPPKLRAVKPLGNVVLVKDPFKAMEHALAANKVETGTLKGRRYEHPHMGIKIDLPEKIAASIDIQSGSIHVRTQTENGGRGSLLFIRTGGARTEEILDGGPTSWTRVVYGRFDDWLRAITREGQLIVKDNRRFDLPVGEGRMREWQIAGKEAQNLRVVFVPACIGRAAFYFLLYWKSESDRMLLDQWMRAFRLTNGAELPICDELTDD